MPTALKYVLIGYFVLVVIPALLFTGTAGLLSLLVIGVVLAAWWLSRTRPTSTAGTRVEFTLSPAQPAAPAPPPRYALQDPRRARVTERAEVLGDEFPEDPLASPALQGVLAAAVHEPPEERARLEDEYRRQRTRYLACREKLDAGAAAAAIEDELESIEAYVKRLRDLGTADDLVSVALDRTGRASAALDQARAAGAPDQALASAQAKLAEARTCFEKGEEQPLRAIRLSEEAEAGAKQAAEQARKLSDLPTHLRERLGELDRGRERVGRELAHVKEDFATAAESYAPSCWLEIRGVGAAAAQAAERVGQCRRAAEAQLAAGDPESLRRAEEELDDGFKSLERASSLAGKIADHLAKLEAAALSARGEVSSAEEQIERAWAASAGDSGPTRETLARARELVAQARAELEQDKPDWLGIIELAHRGRGLAEGKPAAAPEPRSDQPTLQVLREALAAEKEQAKVARDDAWAQGLVSPSAGAGGTPLLDHAEQMYQAALERERTLTEGDSSAERERLDAAVEAFRQAHRLFLAAREDAESAYTRSISERRRRAVGSVPQPSSQAELLVWGAFAIGAALLSDD